MNAQVINKYPIIHLLKDAIYIEVQKDTNQNAY